MNVFEQIINAIGNFLMAVVGLFMAFLQLIVDFFESLFSIVS